MLDSTIRSILAQTAASPQMPALLDGIPGGRR